MVCRPWDHNPQSVTFPSGQNVRTYLANVVVDRLRTSNTVRKIAIMISATAAKAMHKVSEVCSPDGKVLGSEHQI